MAKKCPSCGDVLALSECLWCGTRVEPARGPTVTLLELVCIVILLALLGAILVPNFRTARAQGQLTSCKTNLKNLATALEMYSTDNTGSYPRALGILTPAYMPVLPNCPAAERETYSAGYVVHAEPDDFTIYCSGLNHALADTPANYPRYSSYPCFIER